MPVDIDAAQQGKNERQRRESKDLKVDPDILRQPEGDINVSQTARNKNSAHASSALTRPAAATPVLYLTYVELTVFHHPLAY